MALATDPALPLADVKILDFSWVGVGPITVKYLADHGATVVRVESHARLDVVRLGPPWHDAKPGIEQSQFYASYNTSKYGIALDLGKPEARAIARRLAAWADVVVESFTPHVMRGWGLAYDDLRALNPRLVMMSTCLQGQTGPHAEYPGFGQLMAALSGFYEISGWPDRAPAPPLRRVHGLHRATARGDDALAALDHQRRTGGAILDVSQFEASPTSSPRRCCTTRSTARSRDGRATLGPRRARAVPVRR
jgi:benzylsuccinate CoA-transferase BbsF subunit